MGISRLELLKKEKEVVKGLKCLSFCKMQMVLDYYNHEIECIETFGSVNPTYNDEGEDDGK